VSGKGVVATLDAERRRDIVDYDVVEDSTPLDPSDTTGGFGQINLTVNSTADDERKMGATLALTDGSLGETVGVVRGISDNDQVVKYTANSRLSLLAVSRDAQPFVGSLTDGIKYHLGLCGITSGIVIDPSFDVIQVKLPGGRVNVYDRLKSMGAAYGFETSLVSSNVVVRPPMTRVAQNYRDIDVERSYDQSQFAQTVQGYAYNSYSGENVAYPVGGLTGEAQVYQVDARETLTYDIPLNASLSSVIQPVCVETVGFYDMSASVYSVVGSDGNPILPAVWLSSGGSVRVEIGPDTRTLLIHITGAQDDTVAPYRIAVPDGPNEYYSSLRVRGDGIFWDKSLMTLYLHDDQDVAPDEIGTVVDVDFMETPDQLYHRMLLTAERYGTDAQTLRVTSGGINRLGDTGSTRYPTIGDVAALYPGASIANLYTELGPTIETWNAKLYATVSRDFENQAFGNVNGARVRNKNSWYRIRSSTIRPLGLDYVAERANLIGDVYHTGETIAQWNARWSGLTVRDVNIAPLIPIEGVIVSADAERTAQAGPTLTGVAVVVVRQTSATVGALTLTGTAVVTGGVITRTATDAISLGAYNAAAPFIRSATGGITLSATATRSEREFATATSGVTLTGTAARVEREIATATGGITLTGQATGFIAGSGFGAGGFGAGGFGS
jgi:hypothetical protein